MSMNTLLLCKAFQLAQGFSDRFLILKWSWCFHWREELRPSEAEFSLFKKKKKPTRKELFHFNIPILLILKMKRMVIDVAVKTNLFYGQLTSLDSIYSSPGWNLVQAVQYPIRVLRSIESLVSFGWEQQTRFKSQLRICVCLF